MTEQNPLIISNLRIRRLDDKNVVIERFIKPVKLDRKKLDRWDVLGFYGRYEDMTKALMRLLLDIPQTGELRTQIEGLNQNIDKLRNDIDKLLKIYGALAKTQSSKDSD